jgi:hypothetical protein
MWLVGWWTALLASVGWWKASNATPSIGPSHKRTSQVNVAGGLAGLGLGAGQFRLNLGLGQRGNVQSSLHEGDRAHCERRVSLRKCPDRVCLSCELITYILPLVFTRVSELPQNNGSFIHVVFNFYCCISLSSVYIKRVSHNTTGLSES